MGKTIDLTGQKFGRWTVIKQGESNKYNKVRWWCKCDCGNPELHLVISTNLTKGLSRSCGCLQKERAKEALSKAKRKYNSYDFMDDYCIGYDEKMQEFYCDLDDYDKIKDFYWSIDDKGYVCAYNYEKRKYMKMHQLIMPTDNEHVADHIHGENTRNDNRKSNLRVATLGQNAMNRKKQKNNTSGVTGVNWDKKGNCWRVQININNKKITVGFFSDFEDAVKARKEAEEKYFGEYSYDNSQAIGM